ncbi:MAG: hypothetical protein M3O91_03250 [Chloroflexota bacterium]|nr:hypothetical protein [Chloroflexota bacterium]
MPLHKIPRSAGWALLGGWLLFWVGAANPRLVRVWSAPPDEQLALVAERRNAWKVTNALFVASTIVSAAGSALFGRASPSARGAAALYGIGSGLRLVSLGVRLGYYDEPELRELGGRAFLGHMVVSNAGIALLGASILRSRSLPRWSGAIALALGSAAALSMASGWPRVAGMRSPFEPPATVHIPLFAVGVAILRASGRRRAP